MVMTKETSEKYIAFSTQTSSISYFWSKAATVIALLFKRINIKSTLKFFTRRIIF